MFFFAAGLCVCGGGLFKAATDSGAGASGRLGGSDGRLAALCCFDDPRCVAACSSTSPLSLPLYHPPLSLSSLSSFSSSSSSPSQLPAQPCSAQSPHVSTTNILPPPLFVYVYESFFMFMSVFYQRERRKRKWLGFLCSCIPPLLSSLLPVLPPWLLVADCMGRNLGSTILARRVGTTS